MAAHQQLMHHHQHVLTTTRIIPIVTSTRQQYKQQEDVTIDIPKQTIYINDKHTMIQPQRITVSSHQLPANEASPLPRRIHYFTTCLTFLLPLRYVIYSPHFYGTDTISWILQGIDASSSTTRDGILALAGLNIIYVSVDVTFISVTNQSTPCVIRLIYLIVTILLSISCTLIWILEMIFNQRYFAGILSLILGCISIFVVCILSISISILSHLLSSLSSHMDETSRIRCHARVLRLRQNMRYAWCAAILALLGCTYVAYESFDDMNARWIRTEKSTTDSMYDLPDYCHCILCLWLRWYFWIKKPIVVATPSITTA